MSESERAVVVTTEGSTGFLRPTRLVDIARHAGVSIKTVSRVLNGEPYVKDSTRQVVMAAVEKLGYITDHHARALRTDRSGYLGLIVPDIRNGFFAGLTNTIEKRLSTAGQTILLGISDERQDKEERYLRVFRQQRIDGLIVLPAGSESLPDFAQRVPVVVLDRTRPELEGLVDQVLVNNRESARVLTSHLIEQHGLTQVAMVAGEQSISSVLDRQLGYADAIAAAGLEPHVSPGHLTPGDAAAGALQLFRRLKPPFGVFATGNRMFWGAMAAISQLGLTVPRDVAVTTFDGSGDLTVTGLMPTQAVLPVQTISARALQVLAERTNDPGRPVRKIVLDADIEYGVTCGCLESESTGPILVRTGR